MRSIGLLFALTASSVFGECIADVSLHSGAGWTMFEAEVVATEAERAQGLMGRETMPYGAGMLFLYEQASVRNFWMKDTPLPLDILFFDPKLKLVSVSKNATPYDETPLYGGENISAVLEINGGLFDGLGLTVKTKMRVQNIEGNTCPDWVLADEQARLKNLG